MDFSCRDNKNSRLLSLFILSTDLYISLSLAASKMLSKSGCGINHLCLLTRRNNMIDQSGMAGRDAHCLSGRSLQACQAKRYLCEVHEYLYRVT